MFQKMLWAVAAALKSEGMTGDDPGFKSAVAGLYRAAGRAWLNDRQTQTGPDASRKESTSDQMLELAKKFIPTLLNSEDAPNLGKDLIRSFGEYVIICPNQPF